MRPLWLVSVTLAVLCGSGCSDLDVVTNTYATMAEARAAGALEHGRMPPLVPAGAHDIREAYDSGGSGRRWGLFSFRLEDAQALRSRLGREMSLGGGRIDAPPRIEWWPVLLRDTLDGERVAATGLQGYPAAGDNLVVAVNWNQRRAYYWTPK